VQVQQTTYTLHNRSDTDQTLYLEHARPPEWELFDTPAPHETTESYWRFRFALPAKQVTAFAVRQRLRVEQTRSFSEIGSTELGYWMEQRYVDDKTARVLQQVIDLQHQAAEAAGQIERLKDERERIHTEQARIRENLQALGDRSSEKDLRERFVKILNTQEDRLEQIATESRARTEEQVRCKGQINALLGALDYETTLAPA
jgi:hypothetical protein